MYQTVTGGGHHNYIFIGEAGSGKSEIAINTAKELAALKEHPVHFFDMDMTKPLFRSRDLGDEIRDMGVEFHYEEQFMDAPTLVGGVRRYLKDANQYVVMDVGGDYIGARAIGGFAPMVNMEDTMVYYVINSYRPWSYDLDHVDRVLAAILGVSHILIEKIHLISNPNLGKDTTAKEVLEGHKRLEQFIVPYKPIDFLCVEEKIYDEVKEQVKVPAVPIHLYLSYPWLTPDSTSMIKD